MTDAFTKQEAPKFLKARSRGLDGNEVVSDASIVFDEEFRLVSLLSSSFCFLVIGCFSFWVSSSFCRFFSFCEDMVNMRTLGVDTLIEPIHTVVHFSVNGAPVFSRVNRGAWRARLVW